MRDRIFVDDGWDIADAVKNGGGELIENFQEFWKKRCDNPKYLDEETMFRVLTRFAVDNFEKIDWYTFMIEKMQKWFFFNRTENWFKKDNLDIDGISRSEIIKLILQTIVTMDMRYDD